jgi:hypothetical protein
LIVTTGCVGVEIDVVGGGKGLIDTGRSLADCRTGLFVDAGAANGFNFGMLLLVVFST